MNYFDILIKINNKINNPYNIENIRIDNDNINKINILLEEIYKELYYHTLILNIAKILLIQPFYDGNSRTLKEFIKIYLKQNGINIEIDYNDKIIPILYDENDNITKKDINYLIKHIK